MNLEGVIVDAEEPRTITTKHGESDLAELSVRRDEGSDPVTVTLWGKWAETAEYVEAGMELVVTDAERDDYDGEEGYATTGDSYVIVEPSFLVNVTHIRSWVQCPRMYYLNKISAIPLNYPVVKGTIVHEVFGDLLRGRDLDDAIDDRVEEVGLELGLLGRDAEEVREDVRGNAAAIDGWLSQGTLTDEDNWRSEQLLISHRFGIKGRADAIRRGMPVELKTGKNTRRDPRFQDKIQAAAYALLLRERDVPADTGTLLYTKNTTLDRGQATGDLSPAKEFSIGKGLCEFVVRQRNRLAAMEHGMTVPTGYEADANCDSCFEQDTCMVVSGRLNQESKAGQIGRAVPEEEREYFDRFYEWLEAERRETHQEYAKLWEQTPEERADDDRALINLEFVEKRPLEEGRWELRAERTGGATSKLREGDLVLASDGHPVRGDSELAWVKRLDDEVVLTADEPVEVTRLDVYPSELTTDRLLVAMHDALLKGDERRKDILFGRADPEFEAIDETFIDNNERQNEAVMKAVGATDCALIHGPPGTGKTYTIARAIRAMVERGERVLLSAFTNRAVDNALEALLEQLEDVIDEERVVRVGSESGIRDDMEPYRLERSGNPEDRVAKLQNAQVVAATTSTCGSRIMKEQAFDVALVDEAAQLTEPGTCAAINLAERFVLVGDHEQLPPVVRAENGLTESLFERLVDLHPEAGVMLTHQYRMNQRIQVFASSEFYDGQLRPATPEVAGRTLDDLEGVSRDALPENLRDPVSFVDVEGDRSQYTDSEEAARIAALIETYEAAGLERTDIGVIAPFRAQVSEISKHIPDDVAVDTVDRFQGSSQEVIIVSFTATGSLEGPIFEDYRRINVALTRPKRALVLVGDASALASDPVYERMLEWARR